MNEEKKKESTEKIYEIVKKEAGMENPIGIVLFIFQMKPEERCITIASGKWALQPVLDFVLRSTP